MKPFENILVPVDFAPHSAEAVAVACDLALRYSGAITLVHVHEPVDYALPEGYVLYTPDQLNRITAELNNRLRATQRDVENFGVSRVDTHLLQGAAAVEIVELARSRGFDLIVMGTHGRTGLKHVLMGSVAERVLRSAPCPVLTVKASEPSKAHEG